MPTDPPSVPAGLLFPLFQAATESYKTSPRNFGSGRSGGRRHGGCDLYAPVGTPVRAMLAGRVRIAPYEFYGGTWAVEIDHGTFVARYGEVKPSSVRALAEGADISPGQVIAEVGKLNNFNKSMLHLELFAGTATGGLTNRGNPPYQRRADLFDPTSWLDAARI
jgi:murein DD-endopeptidase MepM/ murein hydrolase activator NlpD